MCSEKIIDFFPWKFLFIESKRLCSNDYWRHSLSRFFRINGHREFDWLKKKRK